MQKMIRSIVIILLIFAPIKNILTTQGEEDLFLESQEFTLAVSRNITEKLGIECLYRQVFIIQNQ